jgi:hypothetical protein
VIKPDPDTRPNLVTWAYRLWLASGTGIAALGIAGAIAGFLVDGSTLAPVGIGVLLTAVGVAFVLMGSRAFVGDARWRSSLAALTLVVVVMLLLFSLMFMSPWFAIVLLVAIAGLFGSLLAYRPESEQWYTGEPPDKQSRAGGRTK